MANTYTLISSVTVGSGGAATIGFTSIPGTYTDLKLVFSASTNRNDGADFLDVKINGNSPSTSRLLFGDGSSISAYSGTALQVLSSALTGKGGNGEIYFPNYTSSANKSYSSDAVQENNQTGAYVGILAGIRNDSSAITSLTLTPIYGTAFAQYSTAYLYGISNA